MTTNDTGEEELQRIRQEKLRKLVEQATAPTLPGDGTPVPVSSIEAFSDLVTRFRDVPVLVDFWAPWCGPCRALAPVFEAVAARFAGKALCLKVNTDQLPALARQFNVSNIPYMLLIVDNTVMGQWTGSRPLAVYVDAVAGALATTRS